MSTASTPATEAQTVWEIAEIHPVASVFAITGTRDYYLVKVKGNPYKGNPWVVAKTRPGTSSILEIDAAWMRTRKLAYREFSEFRRDIANYLTAPVKYFTGVSY